MTISQEVQAMPQRAHPYRRVSDHSQKKGQGLRRQGTRKQIVEERAREGRAVKEEDLRKSWVEEICEREGWFLDDTYQFTDAGKSGFHGDNRGPTADLTRFLDLVEHGQIPRGSVLLVENIDRLSREDVDTAYDLFKSILRAGIWIATKMPARIYKSENTGLMDLMEPIWLMYLAHEESLKKSKRLLDLWEERRDEARATGKHHGSHVPEWLTLDDKGAYQLIQSRKDTIREMCRMVTQGLGFSRLTTFLRGHPERYPAWGASGEWSLSYVRRILRGREILGEYQPTIGRKKGKRPAGDPLQGYYPAVIEEDEWRVMQATIDGRIHRKGKGGQGRPGQAEANLFTGIVTEARTRTPMCVFTAGGRDRKGVDRRYRYMAPVTNTPGNSKNRLPYRPLEDMILDTLGELKPRDVLPAEAAQDEREARIAELSGRIIALDHRVGEVQGQIEDPDNAAAVGALAKSLNRIIADKQKAEKEREALRLESRSSRAEVLTETQSIVELVRGAAGTEKEPELRRRLKASIRWLVDEIWIVCQRVGPRKSIGHVQIYLKNGRRLYLQVMPHPSRRAPVMWNLAGVDFRTEDVSDFVGVEVKS